MLTWEDWLNTPVLTRYGDYRFEGPLTLAAARQFALQPMNSAIGHAGTGASASGLPFLPLFTMLDLASLAGLSVSQVGRIIAAGEWQGTRQA